MTWVKVSDDFYDHPKFDSLGLDCVGAWVTLLAYCNRNLTDGFVSHDKAARLADEHTVRTLVEAELLEPAPGGFRFHDFAEYQPTKDRVLAEREATRDRVRRFRAGRNGVTNDGGSGVGTPTPVPGPVPVNPSRASSRKDVSNAAVDSARTDITDDITAFMRSEGVRRPSGLWKTLDDPERREWAQRAAAWRTARSGARPATCLEHRLELPCRSCAADLKARR